MNTGWRARLFYQTRDHGFLWKGVALILGVCIAISMMIVAAKDDRTRVPMDEIEAAKWATEQLQSSFDHLKSGTEKPEALAEWLRKAQETQGDLEEQWAFDPSMLILGKFEVGSVIDATLKTPEQRELFADYARYLFLKDGTGKAKAVERLHAIAAQEGAVRFAHEFSGDAYRQGGEIRKAQEDYLAEGAVPEAKRARHAAFGLALKLEDGTMLKRLIHDPLYSAEIEPAMLMKGAEITSDRWLLLKLMFRWMATEWTGLEMLLGLLSAAVWYVLLIYGSTSERGRWLRYLPVVGAGVLSVALINWWLSTLHYGFADETQTPTHEVIANVLYVGVPEETAKLLLFALTVPFLIRKKASRAIVALTAGCVGLGFALAENLGYYQHGNAGVAMGRLLTANFLHITMTGLLGLQFAMLVKTRFHAIQQFVTAYALIVLAHGTYDFACGDTAAELGIGLLQIVILYLLTKQYLHELHPGPGTAPRQIVSRVSVFVFGTALVVGVVMILGAIRTGDNRIITATLKDSLGLIPVALIYVREFSDR